MPERSFLTQVIQLAPEATPGTLLAATRRLQTIDFATNPQTSVEKFRPQGFKFDTVVAENREWVEAGLKISPTYTELIYPLSSVINNTSVPTGAPTTIVDGLTDTTGRLWTFEPSTSNPDTPQTFSVEQGSSVRAHRFGNVILTDFGFKFTREKTEMSGKAIAQALVDNFTLTAGTTTLPLIPITGNQLTVYLDTTSGGLGTTKIARLFDFDLQLGGRFGPIWPVDASLASFATTVETEPKASIKVIVEADTYGMGTLLPLARNSGTMFLRLLAVGPNIYTGGVTVNYQLRWDFAVKIEAIGAFSNQQGTYALEYTFDIVHDATWGKATHCELTNKQSTL